MDHHDDRPSTETNATPKPPAGENIKNLVTPGDDASEEAEAEYEQGATSDGDDTIEGDVARPLEADEAQSPT